MEVQNKQDVMNFGQELEKTSEKSARGIAKLLKKLFKIIASGISDFRKLHRDGFKAIQSDGETKEIENMTNLSIEEVEYIARKAEKDGVPVTFYEFNAEKGKEDAEYFGKGASISKQRKLTKHIQKIDKISQFEKTHPKLYNLRKKHYSKLLYKNSQARDKIIKNRKGNIYRVSFNKSRTVWAASVYSEIKKMRTGVYDSYSEEKGKEFIERVKEHGLDLNIEEIREFMGTSLANGTVDESYFVNNYYTHTVSLAEFERIDKILRDKNFVYAVERVDSAVVDEQAEQLSGDEVLSYNSGVNERYTIRFDAKDLDIYKEECGINEGLIMFTGDTSNRNPFSNVMNDKCTIECPTTSIGLYLEKFRGEDIQIYIKDSETSIVSIDYSSLDVALELEKKTIPVDDEREYIRQNNAKNIKESTKLEKYDSLLKKAADYTYENNGNINFIQLQRYFAIGFNRSKDLIDQLEEYGVIKKDENRNTYSLHMTKEEFDEKYSIDSSETIEDLTPDVENILENAFERDDDKDIDIGGDE